MSWRAFALALAAALALHAGLLMAFVRPEAPRMAGSDVAPEAQLGNSFADMAKVAEAVTPEPAVLAPRAPKVLPALSSPPAPQTPSPVIEALAAVPMSTAPAVIVPQAALPQPAAKPEAPKALRPQSKPKTAQTVQEKPAAETARTPKKKAAPKPQKAARKGSAAGTSKGKSASAPKTKKKAATPEGNASVSNYKGRVMRHLSRRVRFSDKGSGVTRIRFTIDGRGRIAGASVSKSSGAAALDRKALQAVRRAAPFPRPPGGKSMTFSVPIAIR